MHKLDKLIEVKLQELWPLKKKEEPRDDVEEEIEGWEKLEAWKRTVLDTKHICDDIAHRVWEEDNESCSKISDKDESEKCYNRLLIKTARAVITCLNNHISVCNRVRQEDIPKCEKYVKALIKNRESEINRASNLI